MNWIELALNNCSDDTDRILGSVITGNLSSLNKYYFRGKGSDYKIAQLVFHNLFIVLEIFRKIKSRGRGWAGACSMPVSKK
jgi:hypothetical protein